MADKLKRCPFCGGEAKHGYDGDPIFGRIVHWVYCDNCHAQTRETTDKDYVFGLWNKRSNWHTGTPTEEGDYLCWVKGPFGIKHGLYYNRCKYKDGNWFDDEVTNFNLKNMRFQVIAWQKITPYKEGEEVNG